MKSNCNYCKKEVSLQKVKNNFNLCYLCDGDLSSMKDLESFKTEEKIKSNTNKAERKIKSNTNKENVLRGDEFFQRDYNETQGECKFCKEYSPEVESYILKLLKGKFHGGFDENFRRWAYTSHGINTDTYQKDTFWFSSTRLECIAYKLYREEKGFFRTTYKHIGTAWICADCLNVLQWKHDYSTAQHFIFSSYKPVSSDIDIANDIFNPPSQEIINLIISKINKLPDVINQIGDKLREEKDKIISLLENKGTKITTSDIAAMLKRKDVDRVKSICKILFDDGEINFAGNNRYFILNEDKKESKSNATGSKSGGDDIKSKLKKFKNLLNEGLITQDDYDAKKKELLGL